MIELRCKGCGRMIGYAHSRYTAYCTEGCEADYPVSATEGRDGLIEAMYQQGHKARMLSNLFGITRQRVEQIIRSRKYA